MRKTKYTYDQNCFNNLSNQDACYWLGYLYADGNLYENPKSKKKTVGLFSTDKESISNFQTFLKTSNHITKYFGKHSTKPLYCLRICDQKICSKLLKLGLIPKKSLSLAFPLSIPKNNLSHFIRGYFDGDGCISLLKRKTKNTLHFSLVGTFEILSKIQEILISELNISKTKIFPHGKVWYLEFNKSDDLQKIKNYLYYEAKNYLNRKKEIFFLDTIHKFPGKTTSIYKNICFRKKTKQWRASFYEEGKRKEKVFKTELLAQQFLIQKKGKKNYA